MGLAEAVLARAPEPQEARALQITPWGNWPGDYAGYGSAAGMNVNSDASLQLLTVYGCVTLIADTIATMPRDIYRNLPDGSREEVAVKPRWFEQPNPTTDIIEFLTQSLTSLLLDGNAYWSYAVDGNFLPAMLRVLDPARMTIRDDGQGPIYFFDGTPFRGRLLHIKGLTRPGALKGLSPVESARQSLGIGLAVQEFAGNFYKNGTTVGGVIQVPGPMTTDQAKDLKANWSRDHGGTANAHLPGVITNGATWQQISVTPEQAQFLESRQFQAAEIAAQMFLLDPSMLGIASSGTRGQNLTYANLEQRGIHLVQFTLLRWIIRLERAMSGLLPTPQYMKFNVDALQRADLKTRFESYRIALGPTQPFMSVNEPRELEELPPLAGGDKLPEPPPTAPAVPPTPPTPQENHHHITVEAAHVHVQPTPVEFHGHVDMPEQVPAVVNVEVNPTPIAVQPAVVNVAAADPAPIHVNVEAVEQRIEVNPTPVTVEVNPTPITVDVAPTPINIEPAEVNVNISPAENRIEVNPTPIEVHPPEVNVLPAEVTVESPIVNVHPQDIRVDAPIVHVRPSPIRIDAPQVNIAKPGKIRRTFERDEQGITIAIIEEPIEDEPEGSPEQGTDNES